MSFVDAKDDTARPVDDGRFGKPWPRVVSALVLALPVLAAVYVGPLAFAVVVVLAALLMAHEWDVLCGGARMRLSAGVLMLVLLAVAAAAAFRHFDYALLAVFGGAFLVYGGARISRHRAPSWAAIGAFYIGVPAVALIWLRADAELGRETLFWLLGVVWATDTGAFLAGRAIGGRRLAPVISPNKTWAGLFGGLFCAALGGVVAALWLGLQKFWLFVVLSAALGLIAQAGDLAESKLKRRFGVKDSGSLIPGHGGMLDRVDGLLAAAPVLALLDLLTGGAVPWR